MKAKAKVIMPDEVNDVEEKESNKNITPEDLSTNFDKTDVLEEDEDDISSLAQDFLDDKPEASTTVNMVEDLEDTESGPNYEALYGKDIDGAVFDPELHATNSEGKPSLTPKGRYRKKKGKG